MTHLLLSIEQSFIEAYSFHSKESLAHSKLILDKYVRQFASSDDWNGTEDIQEAWQHIGVHFDKEAKGLMKYEAYFKYFAKQDGPINSLVNTVRRVCEKVMGGELDKKIESYQLQLDRKDHDYKVLRGIVEL
jgi:hypothetical protein